MAISTTKFDIPVQFRHEDTATHNSEISAQTTDSRISVVIVSRNEGANRQRTLEQFARTLPASSEIVIVNDSLEEQEPDLGVAADHEIHVIRSEGIGVTNARNLGASHAEGDVVVFADAHVDVPPGWWHPVANALSSSTVGAVAPAISVMGDPNTRGYGLRLKGSGLSTEWLTKQAKHPYPVPILPGCFLAMRKDTFLKTGGFDSGMDTWGMSDIELSIRLWLLGYELRIIPEITVPHLFRKRHPYPVSSRAVIHNMLRTAFVHFNPRRVELVIGNVRDKEEFPAALAMLIAGNYADRRSDLAGSKVHTDDWFFQQFGPDF